MMYQCCLIALMIANCVSSAEQTMERRTHQPRRPGDFPDDSQNRSQIEAYGGRPPSAVPAEFVTDERRATVSLSAIEPLIEQDAYDGEEDDDADESTMDDDDTDDEVVAGQAATEDGVGGEERMSHGNVIIREGFQVPPAVVDRPVSAKLTATSVHANVLSELESLEAIEKSIEKTGPKHRPSQHHFQLQQLSSQQPEHQQRTAESIVQSPSSLLDLTANPAGGFSLSTTDLSGLTVSTSTIDIPSTNLSLALMQRRPSNAQAVALVQSVADVSTPALEQLNNDPPELPQSQAHSQPEPKAGTETASSSNPSGPNLHRMATGSGTTQTTTQLATANPNGSQHQQQQQRHRTINSMNLNPTTPAMVVKPVGEHRKLLKSTGPILNYVFDHHPPYYKSNYYNARYGPHFETDNVTNITVQNGDTLFLSCRISLLQDKTVSWVRRKSGDTALQLLTVGKQTYSGDSRYQIEFQYPNNWRLKISQANKNDEGVYECQISTHPPKVIIYYLHVNAPEVLIVDEEGEPLYDKYYEVGSTIKLMCKIRHISMLRSVVYWIHNENILNHDTTRGGISVKTNLTSVGANSTLFVAKVNRQDSGSYTCSIGPNQHYSISVHVLNGTANPYGIYQRSCAFSTILQAVDLWFVVRSLLFLLLKLSSSR
ncbi:uncharacterized protein LOC118467779 [Anopheles albimanus]|uniref:uncharacterized protein LOC118467779 n=1 Tax=Anopheles albimanus TaxID=7167 RepID=UPI00163E6D35|nr:uncharacterized protein LOC118467779 [Anopheles albimanus]XP_035794511.1 uncharacterized protein LOC118467779 [Anopheles albimanus]XP_035794512.1 uncharacterized protein LOC118467779 [Anopheles albimanus]